MMDVNIRHVAQQIRLRPNTEQGAGSRPIRTEGFLHDGTLMFRSSKGAMLG